MRVQFLNFHASKTLENLETTLKTYFCEASHSHGHSPTPTHSHSHSHLILDPGSAYYDDAGGGFAPSSVIGVGRSRIQDQVAVVWCGVWCVVCGVVW